MFMPLIMAGAVAEAYNEDVAAKKAEVAQIKAVTRKYLLEEGISRLDTRKKALAESRKRISAATGLGFDKKAAIALEASGELPSVLTRLEKLREDPEKDISTSSVKKMSQAIVDNIPEDKLAEAMNYALDLGAAEEMTVEKLINTIFYSTDDSEAFAAVSSISTGTGMPSIDPTGVNLIGLTEMTPEKTQKVRNLIEDRLKDSLGRSLTETGYVWDNPTAANTIIENALDYYLTQRADPFLDKDLADVTSEISDKVQTLISENVPLNVIADQYDFSITPTEFEYTPPTVVVDPNTPPIAPPSSIVPSSSESIIDKNNLATQ